MQDIVPKKSIREITKPRIPGAPIAAQFEPLQASVKKIATDTKVEFDEYPHKKNTTQKKGGWGRIIFFFSIVLILGVAIFLHLQKSATVYITPEQQTLTFKDSEIVIPITEIMTLSASATSTIDIKTSTGTPVLTKAKGTVTIYNGNSTDQSLVAQTRLESPNGKIYRLDAKILVPKASVVAGKTTPGSIQALVTADKTGASYNTTQSDFTFPGLAGSPRYKNVYARTKGALSGGSETKNLVLDEKDKNQKIETLIKEGSESLKTELVAQKTSNMISIHESGVVSTFEKLSETKGTVVIRSTLSVIDSKKLATILTKNQKPNISTQMEFIDNQKLAIEYVSENKTDVRIKVQGPVNVKTDIQETVVRDLLALQPFTQFRNLIKTVNGIQEVSFTSKPFWTSSFPQASRIFIEEK